MAGRCSGVRAHPSQATRVLSRSRRGQPDAWRADGAGAPPCGTFRSTTLLNAPGPLEVQLSGDFAQVHQHQSIFAALAVAVAIMGSWTALDLFQRVRTHTGRPRVVWLAIASFAMGSSIWSMHFIAMLGFDPGSPVSYDPLLTAVSLLLALGGTALAFFAAASARSNLPGLILSGAAMGLAICAMHYVGMAALRTAVALGYHPGLVLLSLAVAVAAATAALWAARRDRSLAWRAVAALVLGLAIVGMHYTAMAALVLTPSAGASDTVAGAPPVMLAVAVATGTGAILIIALAASLYDQRQALLEVLDAGGIGYWEFSPRSGQLSASPRAKIILGLSPDAPLDQAIWRSTLSPESQIERDKRLQQALGPDVEHYSAEYRLRDCRWISLRGRVVRDRSSRPTKVAGILLDVSDRERAFVAVAESEKRQRLLINELNHRVKNSLATIQAIASLTARRAVSVSDFLSGFQARLIALSTTHNLLTAQGWEQAELRSLLDAELGPYPSQQVKLEGPEVWLPAEQALAIGMIAHELATNAAKYGALSCPDGCVQAKWVHSGGELHLRWLERGGPAVSPPDQKGFGSQLIQRSVQGSLRGTVETDFSAGGLQLSLRFPVQGAGANANRQGDQSTEAGGSRGGAV